MLFKKAFGKDGVYHTPQGPIELNRGLKMEMIRNFNLALQNGLKVPLTWDHVNIYAHDQDDVPFWRCKDIAGWVKQLSLRPDGQLEALVDVPLDEDAKKIGTTVQEVSPVIHEEFIDGKKRAYRPFMGQLALCMYPVEPGQPNFELAKPPTVALSHQMPLGAGKFLMSLNVPGTLEPVRPKKLPPSANVSANRGTRQMNTMGNPGQKPRRQPTDVNRQPQQPAAPGNAYGQPQQSPPPDFGTQDDQFTMSSHDVYAMNDFPDNGDIFGDQFDSPYEQPFGAEYGNLDPVGPVVGDDQTPSMEDAQLVADVREALTMMGAYVTDTDDMRVLLRDANVALRTIFRINPDAMLEQEEEDQQGEDLSKYSPDQMPKNAREEPQNQMGGMSAMSLDPVRAAALRDIEDRRKERYLEEIFQLRSEGRIDLDRAEHLTHRVGSYQMSLLPSGEPKYSAIDYELEILKGNRPGTYARTDGRVSYRDDQPERTRVEDNASPGGRRAELSLQPPYGRGSRKGPTEDEVKDAVATIIGA